MENDEPDVTRRRVVDTTNRQAATAVAEVTSRLQPLRSRIALIAARAQRRVSAKERQALLNECDEIRGGFRAARQDLIIALTDAPPKVKSHSRVLDVQKAIDNLEMALENTRATLQHE